MKLSIVIVNFNVKYFLQQCLLSIQRNHCTFNFEIIVVDNASSDGSLKVLPAQFPEVQFYSNKINLGFSKAVNAGIEKAKGEYILVLNPDTLLQEDTLQVSVDYLDSHPSSGAIGVRMIDGSGKFLPESKRGFPTPMASFYKVTGINAWFPRSGIFNRYYLGHLEESSVHSIEVLTGAYMMIRSEVLNKIGNFDEQFFMYGEDIDLSFRIHKAGYQLTYLPQTSIIHFKGESTDRNSLQYLKNFYKSMVAYTRKHYSGKKASVLKMVLQVAILLNAIISMARTAAGRLMLPVCDFLLIFGGLYAFKIFWANFYHHVPDYYAGSSINWNILTYTVILQLSLYLTGAYDYPYRLLFFLRGFISGWIVTGLLYSFVGPLLRPSRALIAIGGIWIFLLLVSVRLIMIYIKDRRKPKNVAVVGDLTESDRILNVIRRSNPLIELKGVISPIPAPLGSGYIGTLDQLDQIVRFHHLDEIIFSNKAIEFGKIISWMTKLGNIVEFKIAPVQSLSVIGSPYRNKKGELYTYDVQFKLNEPLYRRQKRLFDITLSIVSLLLTPILMIKGENPLKMAKRFLSILSGRQTWVGYCSDQAYQQLPKIRPGIFPPVHEMPSDLDQQARLQIDLFYAKDYSVFLDLKLIFNHLFRL